MFFFNTAIFFPFSLPSFRTNRMLPNHPSHLFPTQPYFSSSLCPFFPRKRDGTESPLVDLPQSEVNQQRFYAKVAAAQRATAEPQSAVVINKYRQRRHRAFEAWCVARRRRSNRPSRDGSSTPRSTKILNTPSKSAEERKCASYDGDFNPRRTTYILIRCTTYILSPPCDAHFPACTVFWGGHA